MNQSSAWHRSRAKAFDLLFLIKCVHISDSIIKHGGEEKPHNLPKVRLAPWPVACGLHAPGRSLLLSSPIPLLFISHRQWNNLFMVIHLSWNWKQGLCPSHYPLQPLSLFILLHFPYLGLPIHCVLFIGFLCFLIGSWRTRTWPLLFPAPSTVPDTQSDYKYL